MNIWEGLCRNRRRKWEKKQVLGDIKALMITKSLCCYLKLAQCCKSTILQFFKLKLKKRKENEERDSKKALCSRREWESESESESRSVMSDPLQLHGLYSPWDSPGQNTGVGSLFFLQGIFPTQGLNPGLQHCRQILYQRSHKGRRRCSILQ